MSATELCLCTIKRPALGSLIDVAEQLLATLVEKPELLEEVPGLEPYDFTCARQFTVVSAMRNLQHRGEPVSPKSIDSYLCAVDEVKGSVCRMHSGATYLAALLRVNPVPPAARDAAHVRAWAAVLRRERHDRENARRAAEATP
jgi:hypothetical protein